MVVDVTKQYLSVGTVGGAEVSALLEAGVPIENITIADSSGFRTMWKKAGFEVYTGKYEDYKPVKHFNITLGNPPFSDRSSDSGASADLDSLFLLKSMEISDRVTMIMRAKHFWQNRNFKKDLFETGKVVELRYLDAEKVFPSISGTAVCVITVDKDHNGPCRVVYADGTVVDKTLTRDTCIMFNSPDWDGTPIENNMAHRWERGKLKRRLIKDRKGSRTLIETMDKGTPVFRHSNQTDIGVGQHGVVFNLLYGTMGRGIGGTYIKPKDYAIGGNIIILKTNSEAHSRRLKAYLDSDEMIALVSKYRQSVVNNRALFEMVPDVL